MNGFEPPADSKSPPQLSPLGTSRSYRWTSMTMANNSLLQTTPDHKKPEANWWSPSHGDTWRLTVPRGRTLDLVAAFDQCAQHEQQMLRRNRLNSEPTLTDKKDVVPVGFADDSMIGHHETGTDSEDLPTVKIKREPMRIQKPSIDVEEAANHKTPTLEYTTPKRPNSSGPRRLVPTRLDMEKLSEERPVITNNSTNTTTVTATRLINSPVTAITYKSSPKTHRQGRRGTQAVVFKSSPVACPPPPPPKSRHVLEIAREIQKMQSNNGLPHKIDAAREIAELRRVDENANAIIEYDEESTASDSDVSHRSVSAIRSQFEEPRPKVQMGVSVGMNRWNRQLDLSADSEVDETDAMVTPTRGGPCQKTFVPREHHQHHQRQRSIVPPFSDIPEERTCDGIDDMFDFVQKVDDFSEEKTLDRTMVEPSTDNLECPNTEFLPENQQSSDTPHFTRTPTLVTPHAGLPVTEYRVSEKEGSAQKVVVHKALHPPMALATSTPKGTATRGIPPPSTFQLQDSFVSSISNFSAVDKANDTRRQIHRLIEAIDKTRHHIHLAEISLIDAKKARHVVQELASQRVLLICRERLKLQLDEVRRLQALAVVRHPPPPINRNFKSTMVISSISLQLNKNFHCRGSFAFIVALKCRTEIEATGVVTLLAHFQTRTQVLQFGEHIHFSNLPVDFVIGMEVYMMRVPEYKAPEKTCAAVLASKVRNFFVPSNAAHRRPSISAINRTSISLPGNHTPPECEFKFCGKLLLDRDSTGDRSFYLDDVTYPLEGTVKLVSHCSSLPDAIDVEYRGHLFLFHDRDDSPLRGSTLPGRGVGATWEKYWALLHRGIIFFWKNPMDETAHEIPLSQIDLTKCTNHSIEETRSNAQAQHEFHIELLIDKTPSLLEKRRVILAAESVDHLTAWLNAINDTLFILRS